MCVFLFQNFTFDFIFWLFSFWFHICFVYKSPRWKCIFFANQNQQATIGQTKGENCVRVWFVFFFFRICFFLNKFSFELCFWSNRIQSNERKKSVNLNRMPTISINYLIILIFFIGCCKWIWIFNIFKLLQNKKKNRKKLEKGNEMVWPIKFVFF